ncbi:unnamed protein product [Hanseniaspora opuntiae]
MSAEQEPPVKKQKPNYNFRQDEDYTRLEEKNPDLKKRKVAMIFGYAGTGYSGLQYNGVHKTIEKEIWENLILNGYVSKDNAVDLKKTGWQRCARTDKGVHALGNLISFKIQFNEKDKTKEEIEQEFITKMNSTLPEQIRMFGCQRVTGGFDAKNSCSSRMYEYLLPTYSFIGPQKDKSGIYNELRDKNFNGGYENYEDLENDKYWDELKQIGIEKFGKELYEDIKNFKFSTDKEESVDPERISLYEKSKTLKALENNFKNSYRLSEKKLNDFRMMMSQYLGYHNFHNYTIGQSFKSASSFRYMININVEDPIVNNGIEWVKIKIHGQSFMLHQIRKMIAMAVLCCRYQCSKDLIQESFTSKRFNIPKAPPLGLYLNHPIFDFANKKLVQNGHLPIDFTRFENDMDLLQKNHVFDKIYNVEVEENIYTTFFKFIDGFKFNNEISELSVQDKESKSTEELEQNSSNPFAFFINCKKRWDDDIENEILYIDDSNFKKMKEEEKEKKRLMRLEKRNERLAQEALEKQESGAADEAKKDEEIKSKDVKKDEELKFEDVKEDEEIKSEDVKEDEEIKSETVTFIEPKQEA